MKTFIILFLMQLMSRFIYADTMQLVPRFTDGDTLVVSWDANVPEDSVLQYLCYADNLARPTTGTSMEWIGLTRTTNFHVVAENKCGFSLPSDQITAVYKPPAPADLDSMFYDLNEMSVIWEVNGITGTYSGNRIGLWNGMGVIFSAPQKDDYWITVTVAGKTGPAMIRINGIEKTVGTISEDVTIKLVGVSGIRIEAVGDLLFFKGIYLMRQLFDCPKPKRVIIRAVTIK